MNTTSIAVYLSASSGTNGNAVISSYLLEGNVPEDHSISVELWYLNGNNAFEKYEESNVSDFQTMIAVNNNYSNRRISLPSGIYYTVLKVMASNRICFVDVIAFRVRNGLTTNISGSCNTYNEISSNNGGYLVGAVIPEDHDKITTTNVTNITSDNYTQTSSEKFTEIISNQIYVFDTSTNALPHVDNNIEGARIPTPGKDVRFAINLNGADISIGMSKQGNTTNESALFTSLGDGVFLTIYNYNNTTAKEGTFVITKNDAQAANKIGKRLQTTIDLNGPDLSDKKTSSPTLNIVGTGALGEVGLSNGKVIFLGPTRDDCDEKNSLGNNETKQGSINLSGSGGNITLDGDVELQGFVGISSWETTLTNNALAPTIDKEINSTIRILNNSRINVIGDKESTARISDDAQGIALYANKQGGKIRIVLSNNGAILTSCEGANAQYALTSPEAGILIDGLSGGEIEIIIEGNSTIDSTNGHGIVIRNCRNTTTTIECDSTSYIYGKQGAINYSNNTNNSSITVKYNNAALKSYNGTTIGTKP